MLFINTIYAIPVLNNKDNDTDNPIRVNNYSYSNSYNILDINKYIVLSVLMGIGVLFIIGFMAIMLTEVQNKNNSKYYTKHMLY